MINYNFFDSIDTEEKAYWLGFFFADGNISKSSRLYKGKIKNGNYRIELSLKGEDIEHLKKFAKAINYEKEIKISKASFNSTRCRLGFNNKHLWTVLNSYGCTPCKSLTLKFPNIEIFKSKDLIFHFIRGYVDGDGNIGFKDKNHRYMQLRILGTEHFLNTLQNSLPLERNNKLFKDKNIFELIFNDRRGKYVCKLLYENANIYLERKYLRYKEFCRLYQE